MLIQSEPESSVAQLAGSPEAVDRLNQLKDIISKNASVTPAVSNCCHAHDYLVVHPRLSVQPYCIQNVRLEQLSNAQLVYPSIIALKTNFQLVDDVGCPNLREPIHQRAREFGTAPSMPVLSPGHAHAALPDTGRLKSVTSDICAVFRVRSRQPRGVLCVVVSLLQFLLNNGVHS